MPDLASLPVSADDIRAAERLLQGVVRPTPLEYSRALSDKVGAEVYLKCENLQRAGSFKIRGAYTRMARLSAEERARGVVAASAGNHAQGVALAAQLLGIQPEGLHAARRPDAEDRGHQAPTAPTSSSSGRRSTTASSRPASSRRETGAVLIHPFDHPDIVAGQGTCGLEILEQCPDVRDRRRQRRRGRAARRDRASRCRRCGPDVRVVGVQAEEAAAYPVSLAAGQPCALERMSTMADGIAVGRARRRAVRRRRAAGRLGRDGERGDPVPRPAVPAGTGEARRRTGRRGRRRRA